MQHQALSLPSHSDCHTHRLKSTPCIISDEMMEADNDRFELYMDIVEAPL